ncbi:hypothetical protein QCA50_008467 [Cerrena zonata]|uniref:F-box domain-containing protein n=1 Tax=Cerrena zonata TaxID=2478898 RepID=A0AAW0G995_9APHY
MDILKRMSKFYKYSVKAKGQSSTSYDIPTHSDNSQTTVPVALPVELLDYIIDFLHDDKQSLSSCALTSRTFVLSSQLHLFHSLSCRPNRYPGYAYVYDFFSEHSHLGRYVKKIYFLCAPSFNGGIHGLLCPCLLARIFHALPHLSVVSFDGQEIECQAPCCLANDLHLPPVQLSQLDIIHISSPGIQHIIKFLNLFSRVDYLSLQSTFIPDSIQFSTRDDVRLELDKFPIASSLRVKSAVLGCPQAMMYNLLIALESLEGLEGLQYTWSTWTTPDLNALLETAADTLKELVLDLMPLAIYKVFRQVEADLVSETEYLEVTIELWDHSNRFSIIQPSIRIFDFTLDLINTAPRSLQSFLLVLNFDLYSSESPFTALSQDYNWDRLMKILSSFQKLEKFTIEIRFNHGQIYEETISRCTQLIEATSVGVLKARGLLRIDFDCPF